MKIAITGGIGSGKSALSNCFRELGYPVFSCDEIYRTIRTEEEYLSLIRKAFGSQAVVNGTLNKEYLSSVVFSDKEALNKLNGLSHPYIMKRLHSQMEKWEVSFAEVPLLFEGGRETEFDRVIIVYRNKEERIRSVISRDGLSREDVLVRMNNQVNYEEKIKMGYTVIVNDGDMRSLKEKAVRFLREEKI